MGGYPLFQNSSITKTGLLDHTAQYPKNWTQRFEGVLSWKYTLDLAKSLPPRLKKLWPLKCGEIFVDVEL